MHKKAHMQSEFLFITLFTNTDRPICKKDEKGRDKYKNKTCFCLGVNVSSFDERSSIG
jgi:hypothetical protein